MAEDITRTTDEDESEPSLQHYLRAWVERRALDKKTARTPIVLGGRRALNQYGAEVGCKPLDDIDTAEHMPERPDSNVQYRFDRERTIAILKCVIPEEQHRERLWAPVNAEAKAAGIPGRICEKCGRIIPRRKGQRGRPALFCSKKHGRELPDTRYTAKKKAERAQRITWKGRAQSMHAQNANCSICRGALRKNTKEGCLWWNEFEPQIENCSSWEEVATKQREAERPRRARLVVGYSAELAEQQSGTQPKNSKPTLWDPGEQRRTHKNSPARK